MPDDNNQNEQGVMLDDDLTLFQRLKLTNFWDLVSSPVTAWFAVAISSLFALCFPNYWRASAIVVTVFAAVRGVAVMDDLDEMEFERRTSTEIEADECEVCRNRPLLYYSAVADGFYLRCDSCGFQTEFTDTIDEALRDWNHNWGKNKGKEPS